jgi:hypothetical protein
MKTRMTIEQGLRGMAGTVVLLSAALAHWHHGAWLLLTAFVGLNLLQSAVTNWCPGVWILGKCGLPHCEAPAA